MSVTYPNTALAIEQGLNPGLECNEIIFEQDVI